MKKIFYYIIVAVLLIAISSIITYKVKCNSESETTTLISSNTSVEELVKKDFTYFDNMAGKIVYYETRIVMPKPFNESDNFVAQEVTNVFQQTIDDGKGGFTTNVFFFSHQLNDTNVNVEMAQGGFIVGDRPMQIDSIKVTFDKAFTKARQSNYAPSKSRYITLRVPLGSNPCNPQYSIGNVNMGQLWVDAYNGNVTDKAPNMK